MRAVSYQSFGILVCFTLLLGVQSQSDIVFHTTETENTDFSPSAHARFLAQTTSQSTCFASARCMVSGIELDGTGESTIYYLDLFANAEIVLDITVGKNKQAFSLELASGTTSVRTNFKVNPSDSWPNNALPTLTGYGWSGNMWIPSSSSSGRVLRFEIKNTAVFPTRVTFKILVTSSESQGLPSWAIIIIIVAIVVIAISVAICVCVKIRRNRRLARERATRAQMANQRNTTSYSQQQPQQMYNQHSIDQAQPMYSQQPQMQMQQQQMYAQQMYPQQQPQMYPPQQQMYAQQPQMYPQQQMNQQYPQQQMYQQQPAMVIQVGQVTQMPQ